MNLSLSFGPNLGLTHSVETEHCRDGVYRTHYVTIGSLHLVASKRIAFNGYPNKKTASRVRPPFDPL